jgi:hypothetical protein
MNDAQDHVEPAGPDTAAARGRTDLDETEPNEGYGLLADASDDQLAERLRTADREADIEDATGEAEG